MTASDNDGRPEDVADIERQRAELAATVGELTDRLDVPTRIKQSAAERAEVVRTRPDLMAATGGMLAAVIVLWIVRRRRRR